MTATGALVCYRFGRFELQPDERRLLAAGAPVRVGPRAFDLLIALVERSGHLVTKDELLERVWPKVVVEENTLQVHVSALRKVLEPDAIATVPGRGYRFTPEVINVSAAPPTPALAPRHNLPHHLTSFIGRDKELAELKQMLGTTRLLTLTGPGGCGKTRLAMQVAADLIPTYHDGIWIVELAALGDTGLVAQTVANVLGIKERAGTTATEALAEHLASKNLLLLLDNAEHLLEACAQLADVLLRRCAQLVILVTSRERLGVAGELTYRVPSLSVPDEEQDTTPQQIAACESARLFIERAKLQQPHLAVTPQNAAALASICRRLDGIALAIELAAPRVRSMSIEELRGYLDQRFGLLTGGPRTALPRHRTLRSLIDWSYDLLSATEKTVLRRVSVFAGGWTLEAAERVCSGEHVKRSEVLDLLTSLADKNLVLAEASDDATRYRLLETVRHYARDRLRETGEEAQAQRQHLAYFLAMAEEGYRQHLSAKQEAWLDRLETERDNLRSTLSRSSVADGDVAGGLRLAGALVWYWLIRGYFKEGRGWLAGLLTAARGEEDATARARAYCGAGACAHLQGDHRAAKRFYEEALALREKLGDRNGIADVLLNLGTNAHTQGNYQAARALYEEGLALERELGDRIGIAYSLHCLGHMAYEEGDYPGARVLLEDGIAIWRELGDGRIAHALHSLGMVARGQGDCVAAEDLLKESLAFHRELSNRRGIAASLSALGLVAHDRGDYTAARVLLKESMTIQCELGDRRTLSESLETFAAAAFALAGPEPAARIWGSAQRLREEIGAPITPSARPWYDRHVAAARAALADDVAFDLVWREGRAMDFERAVQYAFTDASMRST